MLWRGGNTRPLSPHLRHAVADATMTKLSHRIGQPICRPFSTAQAGRLAAALTELFIRAWRLGARQTAANFERSPDRNQTPISLLAGN